MIETNEKENLNTEREEIQMDGVQKRNELTVTEPQENSDTRSEGNSTINAEEAYKEVKETNLKYREECKKELEKRGVRIIGNKATLTPIIPGEPYLIIELLWDKNGKRKYHLDEIEDGERLCINDESTYISPILLKADKFSSMLSEFLMERSGEYTDDVEAIKQHILNIENNRLLTVDKSKCLNCGLLTNKEILKRIEDFMLSDPLNKKIGFVNSEKTKLLGIVGRENNTAYQNFRKLIGEIAPENNVAKVKEQLKIDDLFICDKNDKCSDCQKTLSAVEREKLGIKGDKIYAFKFDEEFLNQFEQEYAKAVKEKQEKEEKTEKGGGENVETLS